MAKPEEPPWASMSLKARGEWVEMAFNAKVAALGLSVSKPYGDNPASALYPGLFGIQVWPETVRASHSQWDQYRCAWRHLSGDPADDNRLLDLTIHAAADDGKKSKLP